MPGPSASLRQPKNFDPAYASKWDYARAVSRSQRCDSEARILWILLFSRRELVSERFRLNKVVSARK